MMKVKINEFLLATILLFVTAELRGQKKTMTFGMAIEKDLFGVPVSSDDIVASAMDINAVVWLYNGLDFSLGFETITLSDFSENRFETFYGLGMGAGCRLGKNELFQIEPNLSVANSFRSFSSFRNVKADLGAKFHVLDVFFIGTGLRYTRCPDLEFVAQPSLCTWYWKMGFQLKIPNKPKPTPKSNPE